jgi:RNA polymerase sigma-70 factor (ECF subfamily)
MSDKELFALAQQKNEEAFVELIDKTLLKIKTSIFNAYNPLNNEDFQDAVQNATIKAWNKMDSFRGDAAFSTWFYTILRNEVLNILKVRSLVRKFEVPIHEIGGDGKDRKDEDESNIKRDESQLTVVETAQSILEKHDDIKLYREMLLSVLPKLKPSHGEIIKLIFEDGKSYEEAAHHLGVPIGTVMSRLYFARQNAQKLIKQYATRNNLQLACLG